MTREAVESVMFAIMLLSMIYIIWATSQKGGKK
jgi:hypothetical protein